MKSWLGPVLFVLAIAAVFIGAGIGLVLAVLDSGYGKAGAVEVPAASASMSSPRFLHTATLLLDGNVLIAGGRTATSAGVSRLYSAEIFNPARETFTTTGAMIPGAPSLTATLISSGKRKGEVLFAGNVKRGKFWVAQIQFYLPKTRGFVEAPRIQARRVGFSAVAITVGPHAGDILFPGIIDEWSGYVTRMTELYNPDTEVMDDGNDMTTVPRKYVASGVAFRAVRLKSGKVLIAGAAAADTIVPGRGLMNSAEVYDPRSGIFIATGNMTVKRTNFDATLLEDGRVLITGGDGAAAHSAGIYNPLTESFNAPIPMLNGHAEHTATLLKDGDVLIAGGLDGARFSDKAELFDPRRNAFEPTGRMITPRAFQSATLLKDGEVLIAGGEDRYQHALASAALYDPKTGKFEPLHPRR